MEFWIIFSLSILFFLFFEKFFSKINRKILLLVVLVYIIFIASFRNNIGIDYYSYISLFNDSVLYELTGIEPTFIWISQCLHYFGFNYSMLFLIYAVLNLIFIYLSCQYYMKDKMFPLSLYVLFPFFFWMSLSGIRQALAVSVVFWGSKFLLEKTRIKFFMCVFIASTIHFSAIFSIFMVFIYNLSLRKMKWLLCVSFSVILGYSNSLYYVLDFIFNLLDLRYVSYLLSNSTVFSGIAFTALLMIWGAVLFFYKDNNDEKSRLVINFYTMGVVFGNLLLFSSPLARLKDFYYIFMIIAIPYALQDHKYKMLLELIIISFCIVYFLYAIFILSYNMEGSNYNIEYEFNFNFLE